MNGIHDMGGMHASGRCAGKRTSRYSTRRGARLFAVRHAMGAWGKWNIDGSRYAREIIPPAEYLR